MIGAMAEVLAGHMRWHYRKNLGYYRSEYQCECGASFWSGLHQGDPALADAIASHQAEALAAAGFGMVAHG